MQITLLGVRMSNRRSLLALLAVVTCCVAPVTAVNAQAPPVPPSGAVFPYFNAAHSTKKDASGNPIPFYGWDLLSHAGFQTGESFTVERYLNASANNTYTIPASDEWNAGTYLINQTSGNSTVWSGVGSATPMADSKEINTLAAMVASKLVKSGPLYYQYVMFFNIQVQGHLRSGRIGASINSYNVPAQ